jgi:hypothetical protein
MTNSDDRRKVQVIKEMRGEKLENKYRYVFFLMKTKFLDESTKTDLQTITQSTIPLMLLTFSYM